jgi:hypothetical protein
MSTNYIPTWVPIRTQVTASDLRLTGRHGRARRPVIRVVFDAPVAWGRGRPQGWLDVIVESVSVTPTGLTEIRGRLVGGSQGCVSVLLHAADWEPCGSPLVEGCCTIS